MNSEQHAILASWYLGELGGEAMFLAMASRSPDRARKWEVLAALERETGRRIRTALATSQAPLLTESAGDAAEARIGELSDRPWTDQMCWLRGIADEALEEMTREATSFPSEMRQLVEFVLAHEQALAEFATRELAGDEDDSLGAVHRLLEVRER